MGATLKSLGIDRLEASERLALVDEILASIADNAEAFRLTDMQRAELDRRMAEDDANPDDTVSWEAIKAARQGEKPA